ncbi:hypothetical protein AB0E69_06540 [Kribbella sp. NPDC026611]|uniref:hypothetical protein n=1 Tax=Kribbella sp. NPDC026611 TaxID=3154911 RepID=UPI0033FE213C
MTLTILLAAAVLVPFLFWVLKGARPKIGAGPRQFHAHRWGFFRRYSVDSASLWPSLILGGIAVAQLAEAHQLGTSVIAGGFFLGFTCGVLSRIGADAVVHWLLAFVCLAGSITEIWELGGRYPDQPVYPYVLLVLLTACFLVGAARGGIANLVSPRRAQVYFAIVDVVLFLVSPGNVPLYYLDPGPRALYLVVAFGACFLLGFVNVGIAVGLMAAGSAVTNFVLTNGASWTDPTALVLALVGARVALLGRSAFATGVRR